MGALATGSGAVLSSGAFSQVESQRDVTIDSVSDNQALLEFAPVKKDFLLDEVTASVAGTTSDRSGFVDLVDNDDDGSAVNIDFSAMENSDLPGNGLNNRSVTVIEDLFHILNAGTTEVELSIHDAGLDLSSDGEIAGDDSLVDLSTQPEGIAFFVSNQSGGSSGATDVNDLGVDRVSMPTAGGLKNWTSGTTSSLADFISASGNSDYNDIGAVTLGAAIDVGGVVADDKINGKIKQGGETVEVTIVAQTTDTDSNFDA